MQLKKITRKTIYLKNYANDGDSKGERNIQLTKKKKLKKFFFNTLKMFNQLTCK